MNFKLYYSKPEEKRSDVEEKVYTTLDNLGIDFIRIDHPPAATINDCIEAEKHLDVHICKNIFLTNNKKNIYCLLLLRSDKKYNAGLVSKQIASSRLSFASDIELMQYLGVTPGSISILSLSNDTENNVTVAIDSDLLKNEFIGCHPCMNTSTLKIKTSDIMEKFLPYTEHKIRIIEI